MTLRDQYLGTRIKQKPDITGKGGTAWNVTFPRREGLKAIVGAYIVYHPGGHPFWDHWLMSCIHLREIEGTPPAVMHYSDATHEMMTVALDPGYALPNPEDASMVHYLSPLDFNEQFKVDNDAQAHEVLEVLVVLACDAIISPDVDFKQAWTAALWKTAHRVKSAPGGATLQ